MRLEEVHLLHYFSNLYTDTMPDSPLNIEALFSDKSLKPKIKTETLSGWILDGLISVEELIAFAGSKKDPVKATCMEALEFATKQYPGIASENLLVFATEGLTSSAPRTKWESAKVIGNIAHIMPDGLEPAVKNLLVNTSHEGTVVRWSAAYALAEILKCGTRLNKSLIPRIEAIMNKEEKDSIKKIYRAGLKKIN